MRSCLIHRALTINNRKIRLRIEPLFWTSLEEIATARATTALDLIGSIDACRADTDLASAIRAYVLDYFQVLVRCLNGDEAPRAPVSGNGGVETTPPPRFH